MNMLTLENDNRAEVSAWFESEDWVVACLCAAWCDTCGSYKEKFAELANLHPRLHFVWIDIEDQADVVGDLDVENFPTLLIQRQDTVSFFGTTLPDLKLADRLVRAQMEKSPAELAREAVISEERKLWQRDCNLKTRLSEAQG